MGKFVASSISHSSNDFRSANCSSYATKEEFVYTSTTCNDHLPESSTEEYAYELSWDELILRRHASLLKKRKMVLFSAISLPKCRDRYYFAFIFRS
jgi:hypothetical protein